MQSNERRMWYNGWENLSNARDFERKNHVESAFRCHLFRAISWIAKRWKPPTGEYPLWAVTITTFLLLLRFQEPFISNQKDNFLYKLSCRLHSTEWKCNIALFIEQNTQRNRNKKRYFRLLEIYFIYIVIVWEVDGNVQIEQKENASKNSTWKVKQLTWLVYLNEHSL